MMITVKQNMTSKFQTSVVLRTILPLAHYSIPYQALPTGLSGGYEFTILTSYQMARMLPTGGYI